MILQYATLKIDVIPFGKDKIPHAKKGERITVIHEREGNDGAFCLCEGTNGRFHTKKANLYYENEQ